MHADDLFYELPEAGQEDRFHPLVVRERAAAVQFWPINKAHVVQRVDQNQRRPEVALAILRMSAQQFVNAVEREEVGWGLTRVLATKPPSSLIARSKDRFGGLHGDLRQPVWYSRSTCQPGDRRC